MNNKENNLLENDFEEELEEIEVESGRKLPMGAIIGIIAGAIAVVAVIVVVLIIALSGNKCEHIDADDNYLCDNCGEHYDDGDEEVVPEVKEVEVTFTATYDNGDSASGIDFTLTMGDKVYNLTSGADGTVKAKIELGAYSVTYGELPEYCWGDTYGVKIEEGTAAVAINIINNKPVGSLDHPFPAKDEEITLTPGQEFYYSCHSTSLMYVSINSDKLVVSYNGETYNAVDGVITVGIISDNINTPCLFSVKNNSDEAVTAVMEIYAPLGSNDNPIELTENSAVAEVPAEKTVYYSYKADKDGILVLTSPTVENEILISRSITRINENGEEEIILTITAESSGSSAGYIYVAENDIIKIGVSYVDPDSTNPSQKDDDSDETVTHNVEFSLNLYAATEEDPAPLMNGRINIRLDKDASIVFSGEKGQHIEIIPQSEITVLHNGNEVLPGEDVVITEPRVLKIVNTSGALAILEIIVD